MRWVNIRPNRRNSLILGALPLLLVVVAYLFAAAIRHGANPSDKILPTPSAMVAAMHGLLVDADPLSGHLIFWADTLASLERLGIALGICALSALLVGMVLGILPAARATLGGLVMTVAVIPPIALLPILFILFGLGETAKVALIVIRDLADHIAALPQEQLIKAQTLGASSWQLALRVALPQALPRLIAGLRLSLGPAWVYLISAEAVASDIGLGYRIFLVRRYLSMDIIIPYVAWISLLAILMDVALAQLSRRSFAWAHQASR
jgi:NitT/TauT family transport system permease protein